MKWRLLLPGASEPRLPELNPSGLQVSVFQTALRSLGHRSIVVVGNYGLARYVGTISSKSTSFTPSSILFRPRRCSLPVRPFGRTDPATWDGSLASKLHGWSRRVLPPGPIGLLRRPFIAIAGLAAGSLNIRGEGLRRKGHTRSSRPSEREPGISAVIPGRRAAASPESITAIISVSLR